MRYKPAPVPCAPHHAAQEDSRLARRRLTRETPAPRCPAGPLSRSGRHHDVSSASCTAQRHDRLRTLPTDIMQLVLGLIPLRPRLLVAALVCRRWSEAARRATTTLPGHLKLAAYSTARKHLPIVTSLCVTKEIDHLPHTWCRSAR